jgi:hypothetical protein
MWNRREEGAGLRNMEEEERRDKEKERSEEKGRAHRMTKSSYLPLVLICGIEE